MKTKLNLLLGMFLVAGLFMAGCAGNSSQADGADTEETAEAEDSTAAAPSNILYVTHTVADYDTWKAGYDAHDSVRMASGLRSIGVARGDSDPNNVHVALAMADVEQAKAFASSEDLKAKMEELGVQGPPDIHYMETVFVDENPIENNKRVVVMHDVEDFDAWKAVFDEDGANREASGFSDRALLRGIDNPNSVCIIFAYDDKEKADAFIASDELKAKMEEAGVVGEPNITFIEWAELNELNED